jgi:hypothetical protein
MGEAQTIMRFAITLALVLGSVGCAAPVAGDAGADRQPLTPENFDVGSTPDGGTPPICPGGLFGRASENRATCTTPPQRCVSSYDAGNVIECTCNGAANAGSWECHELRP